MKSFKQTQPLFQKLTLINIAPKYLFRIPSALATLHAKSRSCSLWVSVRPWKCTLTTPHHTKPSTEHKELCLFCPWNMGKMLSTHSIQILRKRMTFTHLIHSAFILPSLHESQNSIPGLNFILTQPCEVGHTQIMTIPRWSSDLHGLVRIGILFLVQLSLSIPGVYAFWMLTVLNGLSTVEKIKFSEVEIFLNIYFLGCLLAPVVLQERAQITYIKIKTV